MATEVDIAPVVEPAPPLHRPPPDPQENSKIPAPAKTETVPGKNPESPVQKTDREFPAGEGAGDRSGDYVTPSGGDDSVPENDSDSDFLAASSEHEVSEEEEELDAVVDSDSWCSTRRRKSKRKKKGADKKQGRVRIRPDNEMTRKLRPLKGDEENSTGNESGSSSRMEEEEEVEESVVFERALTEEESKEQLAKISGMWEMAVVFEFLHVFKSHLNLSVAFTADALEEALVKSPGQGLLTDLHLGLLRGISPRSQVNETNWASFLANKLSNQHRRERGRQELAFAPLKGHEMEEYANLPTVNRVFALKCLCEIRGDCEDIRNTFEVMLNPRKAKDQQQKAKFRNQQNHVVHTVADFRRVPFGTGATGETYWFLDMYGTCGVRMYKDIPAALRAPKRQVQTAKGKRGAASKGKGRRRGKKTVSAIKWVIPEPVPSGEWSLVASSIPELEALGEDLQRTRKRHCTALGKRIFDEIIPELENRALVEQKRRKAAEKLKVSLGNIILDSDGGLGGRSRRQRKEISYRFDDYDRMIDEGIKATKAGVGREGASTRSTRQEMVENGGQDRQHRELQEALLRGQRRGRSAAKLVDPEIDENNERTEDIPTEQGQQESPSHTIDPPKATALEDANVNGKMDLNDQGDQDDHQPPASPNGVAPAKEPIVGDSEMVLTEVDSGRTDAAGNEYVPSDGSESESDKMSVDEVSIECRDSSGEDED